MRIICGMTLTLNAEGKFETLNELGISFWEHASGAENGRQMQRQARNQIGQWLMNLGTQLQHHQVPSQFNVPTSTTYKPPSRIPSAF